MEFVWAKCVWKRKKKCCCAEHLMPRLLADRAAVWQLEMLETSWSKCACVCVCCGVMCQLSNADEITIKHWFSQSNKLGGWLITLLLTHRDLKVSKASRALMERKDLGYVEQISSYLCQPYTGQVDLQRQVFVPHAGYPEPDFTETVAFLSHLHWNGHKQRLSLGSARAMFP